ESLLGAVGDVPQPQTARLATGVAIVHDVRTLDRHLQVQPSPLRARSEERRVGKGRRSRWARGPSERKSEDMVSGNAVATEPSPRRTRRLLHRPGFFFFQAEDGIRDFHVTGVQTCALPI